MNDEDLPLATVFREVFVFLTKRQDVVLFGAHAVNAYCETKRPTNDVNVLTTRGAAVAQGLAAHLLEHLHIAVRVRALESGSGFRVPGLESGSGFRVYQVRKPKNRHLGDVREVQTLPPSQEIDGVRTITPVELLAMKAISVAARKRRPQAHWDRVDLHRLLRTYPALRSDDGPVQQRLTELGAPAEAVAAWREVVREQFLPDDKR